MVPVISDRKCYRAVAEVRACLQHCDQSVAQALNARAAARAVPQRIARPLWDQGHTHAQSQAEGQDDAVTAGQSVTCMAQVTSTSSLAPELTQTTN